MKGIVLAGGLGSRLSPLTFGLSKQLLPVYDKPLIFYPIATLMLAKIRNILIITAPEYENSFRRLLEDNLNIGVEFTFATQDKPRGIAEAFIIGDSFIGNEPIAMVLGDNIFYGQGLGQQLSNLEHHDGALIFGYKVSNPSDYGVIEFDSNLQPISLEEKPVFPKSNFAVPGLYFYDQEVVDIAKKIEPGVRGELEISTINEIYLKRNKLKVHLLPRGTAWLDAGTFDNLHAASSFIKVIEDRQGYKVACLEEIAWRNGWISIEAIHDSIYRYQNSPYGKYLESLL